jgi:hypothetical protein
VQTRILDIARPFTFMGEGYMDEGMPPTEDGEEEEEYLVAQVDPLEASYVALAIHIYIARCVATALGEVRPVNTSNVAVYLVRREIRAATITRRDTARAYVEEYGVDSYNYMNRTVRILCSVMKDEIATLGIQRTTLYNNALVAAANAVAGGLTVRNLQENGAFTIARLMAQG